jgi:hypothetical protein
LISDFTGRTAGSSGWLSVLGVILEEILR